MRLLITMLMLIIALMIIKPEEWPLWSLFFYAKKLLKELSNMADEAVSKPRQEEIEIEGQKFILQHPGAKYATEMRDRCKNKHGQLMESKFYGEIMKTVIVDPKVSWSFFDQPGNEEKFQPLMEQAIKFLIHDKTFRQSDL